MKKFIALAFAIIALAVAVCSCGNTGKTDETTTAATEENARFAAAQVAGSYSRKNNGGSDINCFSISLQEDGTCTYYETMISSYIGFCKYTLDGDVIVINDHNLPGVSGSVTRTYKFRYNDDKLIFLAGESDKFMYITLPDGAIFDRSETALEEIEIID